LRKVVTRRIVSVDITVSSRNAGLPDALVTMAREKIGRLDRFGGGIRRAEVHFYEEKNPRILDREVCEVRVDGLHRPLVCRVAAPDGFVAVDRAVAKLGQQLQRLKSRKVSH
jgi:putative sigma-54 modulation protein